VFHRTRRVRPDTEAEWKIQAKKEAPRLVGCGAFFTSRKADYLIDFTELFASETLRAPITKEDAADAVCGTHQILRTHDLLLRAIRAAM
jgi:hypothetical protein